MTDLKTPGSQPDALGLTVAVTDTEALSPLVILMARDIWMQMQSRLCDAGAPIAKGEWERRYAARIKDADHVVPVIDTAIAAAINVYRNIKPLLREGI